MSIGDLPFHGDGPLDNVNRFHGLDVPLQQSDEAPQDKPKLTSSSRCFSSCPLRGRVWISLSLIVSLERYNWGQLNKKCHVCIYGLYIAYTGRRFLRSIYNRDKDYAAVPDVM